MKSPKPIPENIERLTHIRNGDLETAPEFKDVIGKFLRFAGDDAILVAQCGFEYDFELLQNELKRNRLGCLNHMKMDTKVLFAAIHPELDETFSTDFLLRYYNIKSDDVPRHDALGDRILIARILCAILQEYKQKNVRDLLIGHELAIRKFGLTPPDELRG